MTLESYRDLIVWQKAMDLVTIIYKLVRTFPAYEQYGLTSQLCRAAVSIPSNIAEGSGRGTKKETHRYASMARGSLTETQTQIEIAYRVHYITKEDFELVWSLQEEIGKMLWSMMKSLRKQIESEELGGNNS